jgi:hypothetical protein
VWCWSRCSSTRHSIGVTVSDTTEDTSKATLTVIANSRNSLPTTPLMNSSGINAAINDSVIDTTVNDTWRTPSSAALNGFSPDSTWRMMFSITTIASSTTNPTAIVMPISDRLSMVYPATLRMPNVPAIDSGIASAGISVAQKPRRNRNTTSTTSVTVSNSVRCTSVRLARIVWVRSLTTSAFTEAGREFSSSGSARRIASTVSTTLPPGCLWMSTMIARLSCTHAACLTSCGPSIARPISRTRTGAPLRHARTRSS